MLDWRDVGVHGKGITRIACVNQSCQKSEMKSKEIGQELEGVKHWVLFPYLCCWEKLVGNTRKTGKGDTGT